jgi:hypothetical protein
MYSSGAGVGGTSGSSYQQQQQFDNKHGYNNHNDQSVDGAGGNPYNQVAPATPAHGVDQERGGDGEPIPKALLDPKVQRQLNKRKVWRPWYVWIVSAIQIAVLVFEFVKGHQRTGQFIQTSPFNPMIGPGTGVSVS